MTCRRHHLSRLCLAAFLLLWSANGACAALQYFVYIPGVPGEAFPAAYKDWIYADGFSAVVEERGEATQPKLAPVLVAKPLDKASPRLTRAASAGQRYPEAILHIVDTSSGQLLYRILLKDVVVASVKQTGGELHPRENVTLDYRQIEWSYRPGTVGAITHFDKDANKGSVGPLPSPNPTPTPVIDSDGDGIPDTYENANGLNPSVNDANEDRDGDGLSNLAEFVAGTRANDVNSVFRVTGISQPDGTMLIKWSSVANKTYHIFGSSTPGGPYTTVKTDIPSAGDGETSTTVPFSGSFFFYEVQTQR